MIIYYILVNLLYLCSFLLIGEKLSKIFGIEENLEVLSIKHLQYPIISIAFLSYTTSILIQYGTNIKYLAISINILLLGSGIYYIFINKNILNILKKKNSIKKNIIFLIILIFYLLLTLSPITDADSLAYHAYFPKKILGFNNFFFDYYNFHESLIGVLELFYVVPLIIKSDYTLQFINFLSFLSIAGIFYQIYKKKEFYVKILCLIIFLSPIFLQLIYSAKPQLLFISLSLLNFCLILSQRKIENFRFIIFSIFLIIFNFLGKPSFLISSFILSLLLLIKIYKDLKILNIIKLIFFALIIYLPVVYARYLTFDHFNINNLINYLPAHLPGYKEFWIHLTNAQTEKLFPLSIFIPTSLNNISSSLGLWPIFLIFIFKKEKNLFFPFMVIFLMILFGLKSNRFYIEPLLWVSYILLLKININKKFGEYLKNLSFIQIIPMIGILIYLSLYFFSSNFNETLKRNRLINHAYGYSFNEIINDKVKSSEFIVYNLRTLYYGNNNLIYPEFEKFTKEKIYYNQISKKKPKYLVLIDSNIKNTFFKNCNFELIFNTKVKGKVNRKGNFFNFSSKNDLSSINIYRLFKNNTEGC